MKSPAKDGKISQIRMNKKKIASFYNSMVSHFEVEMHGSKPIFLLQILNNFEDYIFEDEEEFTSKWRGYYKQYLGLKAKRWKLNDSRPANTHQDHIIVCKICERKFKIDQLTSHSKDCLELSKEVENFSNHQKQIIKLAESASELKQEITVKCSLKR